MKVVYEGDVDGIRGLIVEREVFPGRRVIMFAVDELAPRTGYRIGVREGHKKKASITQERYTDVNFGITVRRVTQLVFAINDQGHMIPLRITGSIRVHAF